MLGPGAGTGGTVIDEVALYTDRPDEASHYLPSGLPVLQTAPALSPLAGPLVGQALTLTPGVWASGATTVDVWQRCDIVGACQAIPGATGVSYVLQPVDAGFTIQVQETATNASGSVTVYTDATDPIATIDGSQPATPPVLPPGTDPAVPADESVAAIQSGGQLTARRLGACSGGGGPARRGPVGNGRRSPLALGVRERRPPRSAFPEVRPLSGIPDRCGRAAVRSNAAPQLPGGR